jgi:hypothetical protein
MTSSQEDNLSYLFICIIMENTGIDYIRMYRNLVVTCFFIIIAASRNNMSRVV